MKLAALCLCFAGCATVAPKTHHTPARTAPSLAPVSAEIAKAQAANARATDYGHRLDGKADVVLKWLQSDRP